MASQTNMASPDTPVSIKITIAGTEENKKLRLSLKDLGPSTLPDKLREYLAVPANKDTVFQRYSDSSASWVALNSSDTSVYKQLFRAAKAKGRLRLRVSIQDRPSTSSLMANVPGSPVDHLPNRSYVQPYVTDDGTDQSPSSRISMAADFKTLSDAPSTITLAPFTTSPPKSESTIETKPEAPRHFWPMSNDEDFCEKTKSIFKRPESMDRPLTETSQGSKAVNEAPLPGFFDFNDEQLIAPRRHDCSPRNDCLNSFAKSQQAQRASCLKTMARIQQKKLAERQVAPTNVHSNFVIWCNECDNAIPDKHWHCSICDGGDYDICLACTDKGALCKNEQHWLVKRFFQDGKVVTSITETMEPKASLKKVTKTDEQKDEKKDVPGAYENDLKVEQDAEAERTCNCCVQVFPEDRFFTCVVCRDFDLCGDCLVDGGHGHHPGHAFKPAVNETMAPHHIQPLLKAGRDYHHAAVCDGCDQNIIGVRHKCLDCPDWDYCEICALSASEIHPGHRLAPFYEGIGFRGLPKPVHSGVRCDGPLCVAKSTHIVGDRFKCAVCHDTDFCARCEALPTLEHNRTHPLLKFRTPVRNVSVSTYGEKPNGEAMRPMGDQTRSTSSKSTETTPPASSTNVGTQVQSSTETQATESEDHSRSSLDSPAAPSPLKAQFMYDAIVDGTRFAPATQFTQTWTLLNSGPLPWPVGCSVCFVGGDSMFNVDPNHPSSIGQLAKALSTNATDRAVAKGEKFSFSVTMRTQERACKAISYWRLKTPNGTPFGHRLWCDIDVRKDDEATPAVKADVEEVKVKAEPSEIKREAEEPQSSQMIFPKLEKESPVSSQHEDASAPAEPIVANKATLSPAEQDLLEDVESLELDDTHDDSSEEGFLTDEEYELIGSSDEMEIAKNGKK